MEEEEKAGKGQTISKMKQPGVERGRMSIGEVPSEAESNQVRKVP
jgi:hypothetical protein